MKVGEVSLEEEVFELGSGGKRKESMQHAVEQHSLECHRITVDCKKVAVM